jgi:hypothetical protein
MLADLASVSLPAFFLQTRPLSFLHSFLTLPYLTLPYLILPHLTLPYLTSPYLTRWLEEADGIDALERFQTHNNDAKSLFLFLYITLL